MSLVTDMILVYRKNNIYSADTIPMLSISAIYHDVFDISTHL